MPPLYSSAAATRPSMPPGVEAAKGKSVDEVLAELQRTPLFMTELPEDRGEGSGGTENDENVLAALQALSYEGSPLENASDFKQRGNECFRERRWADAKEFYGKGVALLVAEARRRRAEEGKGKSQVTGNGSEQPGKVSTGEGGKKEGEGEGKAVSEKDDAEQEVPGHEDEREDEAATAAKETALLETLYVNSAACHLELRNYRSCTLDCAAALRLNPRNVKAYYRSARALLALDRVAEADDACARGLEAAAEEGASNAALQALAQDIARRSGQVAAKTEVEKQRAEKARRRALLLKAALATRGVRTRATKQPPDMDDTGIKLVPDPDDPHSTLTFPVVLLYPLHLESDFIKAFGEAEALDQHFGYVFPLPWDREGMYSAAGVECYAETRGGRGLAKVGRKVPLLRVLTEAGVEVVDELVKIYVVPKAKAEGWVKEFKEGKAKEAGETK